MKERLIVGGVDVGSLYTKAVIMEANSVKGKPRMISSHTIRSGAVYKSACGEAVEEAARLVDLQMSDIDYVVSTGYGRYRVAFGDSEVSEISCHARGAKFLFPDVSTLIDIGGQDSRVISIDEKGGVANFIMNDKCAAGTGRFIEVMAEGLELGLEEMGKASLRSKVEVRISSTCTVFAESEIISLLSEDYDKIDIAAAIFGAIARRVMGMLKLMGIKERVAMSGGVGLNVGMVSALEKKVGTKILIAENPQIVGALGAAIFGIDRAWEKLDRGQPASLRA